MKDIIPINIGYFDQLARFVLGLLVFSMYFVGPKSDWALLALVPVATAILGYCPLYTLLGVRTN